MTRMTFSSAHALSGQVEPCRLGSPSCWGMLSYGDDVRKVTGNLRNHGLWFGLAAVSVLLAGCGSSAAPADKCKVGTATGTTGAPDAGNCMPFAACGGDPLGTWQVQSVCGATVLRSVTPGVNETCMGKGELTPISATGSLTFTSDGQENSQVTITYQGTDRYPASCLDQARCDDEASAVSNIKCLFDASSGCVCTHMDTYNWPPPFSTYHVEGPRLVSNPGGQGIPLAEPFCVSSDTLTLQVDSFGSPVVLTATARAACSTQ